MIRDGYLNNQETVCHAVLNWSPSNRLCERVVLTSGTSDPFGATSDASTRNAIGGIIII